MGKEKVIEASVSAKQLFRFRSRMSNRLNKYTMTRLNLFVPTCKISGILIQYL